MPTPPKPSAKGTKNTSSFQRSSWSSIASRGLAGFTQAVTGCFDSRAAVSFAPMRSSQSSISEVPPSQNEPTRSLV